MSQETIRVGKKGALYLPRRIMRELGIGPGDRAVVRVIGGNKVLLEFIPDPLTLALRSKKWARTSVEEFEKESEEEQNELYGS